VKRTFLLRCALLAAPGAVGLAGLLWILEPTDIAKVACLTLLGPYLLGLSKLYEGYAIRKTQRALLVLVPAALQAADKILPGLIARGAGPEELKEQLRAELARTTNVDWGLADKDSLIEEAVEEAGQRFNPFVFIERVRDARDFAMRAMADGTLSAPSSP
jgi:hypothetical protein